MTAVRDGLVKRELRVELCRDADVPLLMHFIGSQWHPGHVLSCDERLLRWQFAPDLLRARRAPGPTVLLAWLGGELVGMLGLTGFDLNMAGERFPAMWLSHWFVTPAHRRYNVALGLMLAARDFGVEALATVGANEVSTRLLTGLGFEVLLSVPRWVGVLDVAAAAELVHTANPRISIVDARRLCRSHVAELPECDGPDRDLRPVGWNSTTAAAWDRFWSDSLAPHLAGPSRDTAHLRWRYLAHPRFQYRVRFAWRDSDAAVQGIVVFRMEQVRDPGTRVLRVVDFLSSPEAEASLVRSVLAAARDAGAALADFYCSSARAAQGLVRAGFKLQVEDSEGAAFPARLQPLERGRFPMTTLVRLPHEWRGTLPQLVDEGRLYITKSDGDQDRPN